MKVTRQFVSEWAWLCFNNILFIKTGSELFNFCLQKLKYVCIKTCTEVYSSSFHNWQKLKIIQMSINRLMHKLCYIHEMKIYLTIKVNYWYIQEKWMNLRGIQFSSVQSLSHVQLFATPWTAARQASLFITNSRSLPKPMSIESVMPSNHLIPYCPLLLLPSIFPSIRDFSNESALCIRWPKYWSFSFTISPSNEHPRLISFRMDWLDLLAVQRDSQESL